jgi:hypothetical protein
MSSHTWTPAALASELRKFSGRCWRLVEAQHRVSTLKIVENLAEQQLLEDLIDGTKPTVPPECRKLDYLLSTPFRYDAEYPKGSRFRRAGRTLGVYYAAETPETAAAEMAFYRLLFFAESPATQWPSDAAEYTAFAVSLTTELLIDLTEPPLVSDRAQWTDPTDYEPCQSLAQACRDAKTEVIRYESVRDPRGGTNLAVLTCDVFAEARPVDRQTWRFRLSSSGVQAICEFPSLGLEFDRTAFAADPRIATLNWNRGAP